MKTVAVFVTHPLSTYHCAYEVWPKSEGFNLNIDPVDTSDFPDMFRHIFYPYYNIIAPNCITVHGRVYDKGEFKLLTVDIYFLNNDVADEFIEDINAVWLNKEAKCPNT